MSAEAQALLALLDDELARPPSPLAIRAGVGGFVTIGDLGDYMDEVNRAVLELKDDIERDKLALDQGTLTGWANFYATMPYELDPNPRGWWDFYKRERSLWSRFGEVTSIWKATADFEEALIGQRDAVERAGVKLTAARPTRGFDQPTTTESIQASIQGVIGVAAFVAVLWGIGQVAGGLRK